MTEFILLHRVNPALNQARFYLIVVGPSLLDAFAVLRIWGRIGGHQRAMVTACESAGQAQRLARHLEQKRLKSGYKIIAKNGGNNG